MAENVPPGGSSADSTRGVPYYEKLKRELRDTLHKKRYLDKNMVLAMSCQLFDVSLTHLRKCSSSRYIDWKLHTWKRPALETSSKASTITSKVPQQLATQARIRVVERAQGEKGRSAMRIGSSAGALLVS